VGESISGDRDRAAPATAAPEPAEPGAVRSRSDLGPDERTELDLLRVEVAGLRRQQAAAARRRRIRWRTPVASLLIVLGCLLAPLSVLGVWTANQVANTDRYLANVQPLISEPSVQHALTDRLSLAITSRLDVPALVSQAAAALDRQGATRAGNLLDATSGSIASGVNGFIHEQIGKFVASPRAAQLWAQANRSLHTQMVKVLSGQSGSALTVVNGQAVLNLGPLIDQVKANLAAEGLTVVSKIPHVNPTYPLFPSSYLTRAQSGYQLLTILKIVLPIAVLILFGIGIYIARSHRRALIGAGLGLAAAMLVLGVALAIGRSIMLGSLPAGSSAPAAADAYDILVRYIREGLRVLLVVGLIVAVGAFFTGPAVTAVKTRGALKAGLGWIRASGENVGLRTGLAGTWTYAHRKGLRLSAVAIASLVFVFWSQPTGLVALVIAIILLIVLGLIELIGRPPATAAAGRVLVQQAGDHWRQCGACTRPAS
jgi:hypothetical protein